MAKRKAPAKSPKKGIAISTRKPRRRNSDGGGGGSFTSKAMSFVGGSDLGNLVLPGLGGYGATRLLARIVRRIVDKKWPGKGKHVGVLSTIVMFFVAAWASDRFAALRRRREPILVGAGVAAAQTAVQAWLPGLAWLLDSEPTQASLPSAQASSGVDFRRRRNGVSPNGVRYVSPGQVQTEADDGDVRYVSPGEVQSAKAEYREVGEDRAADEPAFDDTPASPEAQAQMEIDGLAAEQEQMGDLYDGVFAS